MSVALSKRLRNSSVNVNAIVVDNLNSKPLQIERGGTRDGRHLFALAFIIRDLIHKATVGLTVP